MSNVAGSAVLALKQSQLGKALMGGISFCNPKGFAASTPIFIDDNVAIPQSNGVFNPPLGTTIKFNLPKNSTLINKCFVEITLSPGRDTLNGGTGVNGSWAPGDAYNLAGAEYNKNAGDLIGEQVSLIYGNTNLQNYPGRFTAMFRRICKNDVDIESTNAMVLGGLSPGGLSEQVLIDAFYSGVTLYCPLEELFYTNSLDESWMPEAYALEGQLSIKLAALGDIVSTKNRTIAGIEAGAAGTPQVSAVQLRYQEITLSASEKTNRLKLYRTPEGLVQHFLDLEFQTNLHIPGSGTRAANTALAVQPLITTNFQLGNIRMDMAEIIFCVNRTSNENNLLHFPQENGVLEGGFGGSFMEGDTTASLMIPNGVAGSGFSTLIDVETFQLKCGSKALFSGVITGFWNRSFIRKNYHLSSQIVGAFYTIPFARYPEDRRNATGHISAAVCGTLNIDITVRNPGAGPAATTPIRYDATVMVHSHNLMQSRGGGIAKAYN